MATALAANSSNPTLWIFIACGSLLLLIMLLGLGIWYYRRWWFASNGSSGEPWTLEDLRQMRARGDLTEGEYQAMRAAMIGAYGGERSRADSPAGDIDIADSGGNGSDFDLEKPPRG